MEPLSKTPDLSDGTLRLRGATPADIAPRLALGRSAEFLRMFGEDAESKGPYSRADAEAWVAAFHEDEDAWVIEVAGALAGFITLDPVDGRADVRELSIGLWDRAHQGRGYGSRALRLLLTHAFGPMGLHRVSLRVLAFNSRAMACYRKLGFVEEGRLRENAFVDGKWIDDIAMGLLAREWRG